MQRKQLQLWGNYVVNCTLVIYGTNARCCAHVTNLLFEGRRSR
jgi:hypothetical protein